MRTISNDAVAALQTRLGTEPITVIEVRWKRTGETWFYADRTIATPPIKGTILDLGDLDNVVKITESETSQEITLSIDDSDGEIKTLMNSYDVHKVVAKVWQWFEGLDWDDRFLLFSGRVNSPIEWNESERTVTISITSTVEDAEFGFCPQWSNVDNLPEDMASQVWPSCFGTPLNVPAVLITKASSGTLMQGVGILTGNGYYFGNGLTAEDVSVFRSIGMQNVQKGHVSLVASCWLGVDDDEYDKWNSQYSQLSATIAKTLGQRERARADQATAAATKIQQILDNDIGPNVVTILGGSSFPQNRAITLDIGGGLFTGYFSGDSFYIQDGGRYHPDNELAYAEDITKAKQLEYLAPGSGGAYDWRSRVPCGKGDFYDRCYKRTHGYLIEKPFYVSTGATVEPRWFWADAGSSVSLQVQPATYVVSVTPGTVISVKAHKTFNGVQWLVDVPRDYYRTYVRIYRNEDGISFPCTFLEFTKTLSTITDAGWSDDIFVTFRSSIGPNPVDIISYIINQYTDYAVNAASFNSVRAKVSHFGMNFAEFGQPNVLNYLQEIAMQARIGLRLVDGIFYMTYLPELPTPVTTITEKDIEFDTITVGLTPTEDLCTKLVATYQPSYDKSQVKLVVRGNISRYGKHEKEVNFFCYNNPQLVEKVATFWMIRWSRTWKIAKFKTFLSKLKVEAMDGVLLDFKQPYLANGAVVALVTSAKFNSNDRSISMECWVPVQAGTMTMYPFAWPANVSYQWLYPTDDDITAGYSMSQFASSATNLPGSNASTVAPSARSGGWQLNGTVYMKLPGDPDWTGTLAYPVTTPGRNLTTGDRTPSDQSFSYAPPQDRPGSSVSAGTAIDPYRPPTPDMRAPLKHPLMPGQEVQMPSDGFCIDLKKTKITDVESFPDGTHSHLADVLAFNSGGNRICLLKGLHVYDPGEEVEGEFAFKYDEEESKFGCEICWLKCDE